MSKVTIIIPVYNVENYIEKCINSCLNQTFKEIEIIAIDDSSTDNSYNILKQFKDKRLKVIKQDKLGVSAARNLGIKMSTSDWIVFLDSDDWIEDNMIETMYYYTKNPNEIDIIISGYYISSSKNEIETHFFKNTNHLLDKGENINLIKSSLCNTEYDNKTSITNCGVPWAKMYRKQYIIDNHCYFKLGLKRMQDTIFNLEAYYNTDKIMIIPYALYHYRINDVSVTHKHSADFDETSLQVIKYIDDFMYEKKLYKDLKKYFDAKKVKLYIETIRLKYLSENCNLTKREKINELKNLYGKYKFNKFSNKSLKYLNKTEKVIAILIKYKLIRCCYDFMNIKYKIKKILKI